MKYVLLILLLVAFPAAADMTHTEIMAAIKWCDARGGAIKLSSGSKYEGKTVSRAYCYHPGGVAHFWHRSPRPPLPPGERCYEDQKTKWDARTSKWICPLPYSGPPARKP